MKTVNISVAGAAGRMGKAVIAEAGKAPDIQITGLYEKPGHASVGEKIGNLTVSQSIEKASRTADVIVDFTSPQATLSHARYCSGTGKAMVIGTTGFTASQKEELTETAESFPCLIAANMSIGVNLLEQLVSVASQKTEDGFDIEIVEVHHSAKADSPSGTALALARAAAEARNETLESVAVYGGKGTRNGRGKNEIGIQSVRGGDAFGDHTVLFLGNGERLELSHRAHNREIFAAGALKAARWICSKPAGIYGMKEVFGL